MLQQNLRNRISAVTYLQTFDTSHLGSYNYATHYSYDIHGNVKELVQEIKNLPGSGQHFKKMEYDYDLVSGKVNEVRYQTGQKDEFRHSYEYDADNRIIQVNTSVNGIVWTKEAKYKYYAHGPLARTELGEYQVQGLDYAYTLQGWMKVMNSDNLNPLNDLGRDGNINPSGPNTSFARDAFGYALGYYTDDFNSISGQTNFEISKTNSTFEDNSRNLYNGNIKQMTIGIMDVNGNRMPEMGTDFYYDQLNRLVRSHAYLGTNIYQQSSPSWQGVNPSDEYYTSYAYDPNGNITRLVRKGVAATLEMDDLKYSYTTGTNRLTRVEDGVSSGNYPNDIDNQVAGNYDYDQTGNLVKDSSAQMHISWNVYGKISQVRKTGSMTIDYEYDATGNRVMKRISGSGSTLSTYYIRDAQGNIMSVYQVSAGVLYLTEQHLYGSSRLGVKNVFIAMNGSGVDTSRFTDTLGMKQYELTNHLGNVQVVVSDRKIPVDDNNGSIAWFEADVLSAYDFFPFGMEMSGRVFNLSTVQGNNIYLPGNRNYPFGYQGSIKDNELCGDGNAYSTYFRELDVRLGRWFAIDPKTTMTPWESPYVSMGDNPITIIDIIGDKWINLSEINRQNDESKINTCKFILSQAEKGAKDALNKSWWNRSREERKIIHLYNKTNRDLRKTEILLKRDTRMSQIIDQSLRNIKEKNNSFYNEWETKTDALGNDVNINIGGTDSYIKMRTNDGQTTNYTNEGCGVEGSPGNNLRVGILLTIINWNRMQTDKEIYQLSSVIVHGVGHLQNYIENNYKRPDYQLIGEPGAKTFEKDNWISKVPSP